MIELPIKDWMKKHGLEMQLTTSGDDIAVKITDKEGHTLNTLRGEVIAEEHCTPFGFLARNTDVDCILTDLTCRINRLADEPEVKMGVLRPSGFKRTPVPVLTHD